MWCSIHFVNGDQGSDPGANKNHQQEKEE